MFEKLNVRRKKYRLVYMFEKLMVRREKNTDLYTCSKGDQNEQNDDGQNRQNDEESQPRGKIKIQFYKHEFTNIRMAKTILLAHA